MSDFAEYVKAWAKLVESGEQTELIEVIDMTTRTNAQNNSLYKWERVLAKTLNDGGIPFGDVVIKLPREFTQENIHALIIHPLMAALYPDKTSTAQLSTVEIQDIYLRADAVISERTGVTVAWPSNEPPMMEE